MSTQRSFNITSESVTVVLEGKTHTVQKGTPNFAGLRRALVEEDWDAVPGFLTIAKSVTAWAKGMFTLTANNTRFLYNGVELPSSLNARIFEMVTKNEDPAPLFKFWEKAMLNPSYRSRTQLFDFIQHRGIPLCEDGDFLAYKGVRKDYKDCHSGKFDNSVGQRNSMDRTLVSDDPDVACHEGLHVGALSYAAGFAPKDGHVVVCKINPKDVVSVPKDCSQEKMRVCEYEVFAHHGGMLPSTTYTPEREEHWTKQNSGNPYAHTEDVEDYEDEDDYDGDDEETPAPKKAAQRQPKNAPIAGTATGFDELDAMDYEALMQETTDVLRKYAANHLKIAGACKIPGGKAALVERILEVRK
jgi:hypothetical protein